MVCQNIMFAPNGNEQQIYITQQQKAEWEKGSFS